VAGDAFLRQLKHQPFARRLAPLESTAMPVFVKNPTVGDGEPLCRTCRYAHIQRGYRDFEEQIFCTFGSYNMPRLVPFKVRECTDHSDRDVPTRWGMNEMALLIEPATSAKPAGFLRGQRRDAAAEEQKQIDVETEKQPV
jgi:hypothetical protein